MKTCTRFLNCLTTAVLLFAFVTTAHGQLGLKIKGGSLSRGIEQDMVFGLNASYFSDLSSHQFSDQMLAAGVDDASFYSGICENMHYRADLLLAPMLSNNTEIRVSMSYIPNRVDMLSYYTDQHFVNMSSYNDEISVGLSYMKYVNLGKVMRFYGGIGTNLGLIHNHRLYLDGDLEMSTADVGTLNTGSDAIPVFNENDGYVYNYETGPNGISQRVFLKGGVALRIASRVELGLNVNYGVGYRYFQNHTVRGTNLIGAGLSLGYSID